MSAGGGATRQWCLLGPEELELREVRLEPSAGEALLEVEVALTCGTDLKVWRQGGHPRMLRPPCPFGHEVVGRLLEIREDAASGGRRLAPGTRVAVANSASCGDCGFCRQRRENLCLDLHYLNGAFADRMVLPRRFIERALHPVPENLDSARAALAEPLACALHCRELAEAVLRRAAADRPLDVLVLGSGPLGLLLLAAFSGPGVHLAATDPHPQRLEDAVAFGAHRVVPAHRDEPSAELAGAFDLAIDATGTPGGWRAAAAALRAGGEVLFFGGIGSDESLAVPVRELHYRELAYRGVYHHRPSTFATALELLQGDAAPWTRLISRSSPLGELPAALRAMARRKVLKVALSPDP